MKNLKNIIFRPISLIATSLLLTSALQARPPQQPKPNLTRFVAVGDSLLAGFRDAGLVDLYQADSIPAIIARQAEVSFPQPLIGWPGINPVLHIVHPGPPPVIEPYPGQSVGRTDVSVISQNLAVPGARVHDALTTRPDTQVDSLTDLILGIPAAFSGVFRSQVEWAEALQPTTILVWIGNMDSLSGAIAGTPDAMTPESHFRADYIELMTRLKATGATLVVANIPDVTTIPFVQPVPAAAYMLNIPAEMLAGALGITTADYLILDGLKDVIAILRQQKSGPLDGKYVLTAQEIGTIRARTDAFNTVIAEQAAATQAIFVDTRAFLIELQTSGADAGSKHLYAHYLGGIFSLDGVHPTREGGMVTANRFIRELNGKGAMIPPVTWLTQKHENGQVVLTWNATSPAYELQSSTSSTGGWSTVTTGITIVNGKNEYRAAATGNTFFRLKAVK